MELINPSFRKFLLFALGQHSLLSSLLCGYSTMSSTPVPHPPDLHTLEISTLYWAHGFLPLYFCSLTRCDHIRALNSHLYSDDSQIYISSPYLSPVFQICWSNCRFDIFTLVDLNSVSQTRLWFPHFTPITFTHAESGGLPSFKVLKPKILET